MSLKGDLPMNLFLLLSAIVILACVLCNRLSNKLGVPTLLAFILLGMFFGCDGVVKIPFENYTLAQNICSVALIFIMFYGGFGTNWAQARPVAVKATVLSSLGTLGTAGLVGLFCWKVLGLEMLLGFLLGAVIASTDAASVFSILRSKHLDLKEGTASLLEVESGSNDPFSYMLTVILLSLMSGSISVPAFVYQVFAQLVYGGALGVLIALAARKFLQCFRFSTDGFDAGFLVAVALLSYVLPTLLGGNGADANGSFLPVGSARVPFSAAFHRPDGSGRGPVSHLCRPSGGGLPADGSLSQLSGPDPSGRLVRDARRCLHRLLHSGHHRPCRG